MRSTRLLLLALLVSFFVQSGCDEGGVSGERADNLSPTTSLTVDNINLPPGTLLSSRVNLSWWGNDPDGYLLGYEYAINDTSENAWSFTTKTDSIFTLPITPGQAADTVLFKIRAVDNDNARDPVGASIELPVRNSLPSIEFNTNQLPPDTTFGIASFGFTVEDQDGLVSLSRIQVAFNDTLSEDSWVNVPLSEVDEDGRTFITVNIQDAIAGPTNATIRFGTNLSNPDEPIEFNNIFFNQDNSVFIRVIDQSEAASQIQQHTWYIKRQQSRTLFLFDDDGPNGQANRNFHFANLQSNGITPDVLDISDGSAGGGDKVRISEAFASNLETLREVLAQWDHIYWMSNNLDRNITFAQNITTQFLNQGGTIFVTIPSKSLPINDELFSFLPVGQIGRVQGIQNNFLLRPNSDVTPVDNPAYPTLGITSRLDTVVPIEAVVGASAVYRADFFVVDLFFFENDYTEFEDIGIKSSEGNLIYFALDLAQLNGNNNIADLINALCIQELGFQQ